VVSTCARIAGLLGAGFDLAGFDLERRAAQYRCMRPIGRAAAALAAGLPCLTLAACHVIPQGGMAERCAALMREAYPGAEIDITKREAAAASLTKILAHVEGNRTNLPSPPPVARHLAVECTFDNDILTGFRWTAGPK
jgi:hypothetical protein